MSVLRVRKVLVLTTLAVGSLLLLSVRQVDTQFRGLLNLKEPSFLSDLDRPKCAIAFYGLPRAFQSLVLPLSRM